MNCEKIYELMESLGNGAADSIDKKQIKSHIAVCPSCTFAFERFRELKKLLKISFVPPPSTALDRQLMAAFNQQHSRTANSSVWWRGIFAGSMSIPKPALAAALVIVAGLIFAANFAGRRVAFYSNATSSATPAVAVSPASPEIIERIKFVGVPVVEERVVTKVIYVERENKTIQTEQLKSSDSKQKSPNDKRRENSENQTAANPDLKMSGTVAENGYFTRTDLSGFQAESVIKAKIIREEKNNEK